MTNIDAVATSNAIKETYRRYLQSLLAVRDPAIDAALRAEIDSTPMLDKGPFLEATPPYAPGASIQDLVNEGVLHSGVADLTSEVLPIDRPLYFHQEQSIRKTSSGRNVVVATGTGSGKTESFLLPVLNSLVAEHHAGGLGPGVRALLLYPMNALANDQMKRLRQVLENYPAITFGRYTGDTEKDPRKARDRFGALNIGEPLLPNELLSRQEMQATPPHLLLTNYAMLEYMLLRPQELNIFAAGDDSHWRFIVVDEAHVYDGSQGAEIAMLLRRVRDRVAPHRTLQCIATSATVGGDADPSAVTRFASNLFGQPFEWVQDEPTRQDLVLARRVKSPDGPFWGPLSADEYATIASAPDRDAAVLDAAASAGWQIPDTYGGSAAGALRHEHSLATLRTALSDGPRTFDDVSRVVFGNAASRAIGLSSMVELGSSLRDADGTTPLSARYHLFLRATEGAFTCLSDQGPHVRLARHTDCPDCDAPVFELGSCQRCGAVHVVGTPTIEGGVTRLRPRKAGTGGRWFVLGHQDSGTDEDEAAAVDDDSRVDGETAALCTSCGVIASTDSSSCPGCDSASLRPARQLKQRGDDIAGCLQCGARGAGTVRVFETGSDASGAVIASALYQQLAPSNDAHDSQLPGEGRKLLAFSDSRQAAAYFAPYLEATYSKVQRRRLLSLGLLGAHADDEPAAIDDVVFATRKSAAKVKNFPGSMTAQQQARKVAPWVMAEVLATDDRQSLEGLGLVAISLHRDESWVAPAPLLALGLSPDESWDLIHELVRTLRQQGAVTMPDDVDPKDEIFIPRLGPIRVRQSGPEPVRKVLSWLPGKGRNRRLDYLSRVLDDLGSAADPGDLLRGIWNILTNVSSPVDWLQPSTEQGVGTTYQIDHEKLRLSWVTGSSPVYQCTICRRSAPVSVRNICPGMGCEGQLVPFQPVAPGDERDHYRSLYQSMHPVPLSALEHTAQWSNTEAASIQQRFIRGQVNTLSCSTTFELGVDVGELQAVLLRNMPPRTANYLQRAGRAGRRSGSAALVVTYAMRRSHDLTKFAEPELMIAGHVRAPFVPLTNTRIDRRHAHSVAMAAFFRWLFENHGRIDRTAGEFLLPTEGNDPSVNLVRAFLTPVPHDVTESLRRILPSEVAESLDLTNGTWATELVDALELVRIELTSEVDTLETLQKEAAAETKYQEAARFQKVGTTLRRRDLLGYLGNKNVLPKYGFPVDSVELRTDFGLGQNTGSVLDLSRDLSQAIYEYAPDASIVAGGKLWTSRGIYRLPGRDLVEYEYYVCSRCGGFRHAFSNIGDVCRHCGEVATSAARKVTIPEFGFIAGREPADPGPRPPSRSWSGAVHVLAEPPDVVTVTRSLLGGNIESTAGPRGQMIAIADGPARMGFWICDWCGHGAARALHPKKPPQHTRPMTHRPCTGPSRLLDLAHTYETDLLSLCIGVPGFQGTQAAWMSVLYALVEAACEALEIARDDIGGSLTPIGLDEWSVDLFDTVSGGAGHVLLVGENIDVVLKTALHRVSNCECGPETSCYGCLRSYGNQRDHDDISRGAATQILTRLLHGTGSIDAVHSLGHAPPAGDV